MKQRLFQLTTIRLTAWYTLILFFISMLFSVVVFDISTAELRRSFRPPQDYSTSSEYSYTDDLMQSGLLRQWREDRISEGTSRLIGRLIIFNVLVLTGGALGSYMLARNTLRPVEKALEAQARFSSDAAHELRTPLTIMQSEIEVGLRNKKATKSTHADLLKSNLDEVEHLRTLTDRLLLLAKQDDLVLEPTSLETAAIEAVNRSVPLAQGKKISIDNHVGSIQVIGNPDSLADLLTILLDNAVKYSPEKSTITLKATKKNRAAILTVADTGNGIGAKDLPHIFDRFYRADTSRSSQNTGGHGLGLSIAKTIVEAHNGLIAVSSKKGKGTTFTITLPLA